MTIYKQVLGCLFALLPLSAEAQVGEFRKDFAIGVNGGYLMSKVAFTPNVPQDMLGGATFGVTGRYTCEKYFKSICAIVAELNYAQVGWKERILTMQDEPVPLHGDPTQSLQYCRKMSYIQIPVMARLGWGRERKGLQGFFQVGPQVGFFLNEKTETNFDVKEPYADERASKVMAQDTMAVENKVDYGVAFAVGMEFSSPKLGHFIVEGRYYYGLGNIYGSTKRDYFASSNFSNIIIKFTYLFDIIRTKNSNIK
jgi:hypothetical protein